MSVAQTIQIQGYIKGENKMLAAANVVAKPYNSDEKSQFTISDEKGYYVLALQQNVRYKISVYYMGFENQSIDFNGSQNTHQDFVLTSASVALKEVEITVPSPITVKQDTIAFNTQKFLKGNERKLEDVLVNLPGFEVSNKGIVYYNGVKINQLLVEGRPFFDGNTKLGVQNIPADAVQQVEVLENYNPIDFIKNFSDSNQTAINVKLKANKRNFWFGETELSKGNQNFIKLRNNLFYYSPKFATNSLANYNNVGDEVFTLSDYMQFQGGINAVFNDGLNFKDEYLSSFLVQEDYFKHNQLLLAENIIKQIRQNSQINGFVLFNKNLTENQFQTSNHFQNFSETINNQTTDNQTLGLGKLNYLWRPQHNLAVKWQAKFKIGDLVKENTILSNIESVSQSILQNQNALPLTIDQNIELHYKPNIKNLIDVLAFYQYENLKNNNAFFATEGLFENLWKNNLLPTDLQQYINTENHILHFNFKHFYAFNPHHQILSSTLTDYQTSNLLSYFLNPDLQLNDSLNHLDLQQQKSFKQFKNEIGVFYQYKKGKFSTQQGVKLSYWFTDIQQNSEQKIEFLPDLKVKYEWSNSKFIHLTYQMLSNISDIENMSNGVLIKNYNKLFAGSSVIKQNLAHHISLHFRNSSVYYGYSYFGMLNYKKSLKDVINNQDLWGYSYISTPFEWKNPSESISINTYATKRVSKFELKINFSFYKMQNLTLLHQIPQTYRQNQLKSGIQFKSLFKNKPNFLLSFENTDIDYHLNQAYKTQEQALLFSAQHNLAEKWFFDFSYQYRNSNNKANNNPLQYHLWNVNFWYKNKKSPWMFGINGKNISNVEHLQLFTADDFYFSETVKQFFPVVWLGSITYKF